MPERKEDPDARRPCPMRVEATGVPVMIMERYCKVSLSADIMMINRIQFLMTFSWNIRFGMSEALKTASK